MTFRYVWHPDLDDYFRLGWMFAHNALIAFDRGGEPTWLLVWPCTCPLQEPPR